MSQQVATQTKPKSDFPALLEKFGHEIKRALPKHLNADRMSRIALTAFRLNPKLNQCDPRSVFAAVIQSAQLGLEIGMQGHAYLVPYEKKKNINGQWVVVHTECQFIPGWKGLVDLVNRTGNATVFTGVIFKDQEYTFLDGSRRELIVHNETMLEDPDDITHAYAVGWVKGSEMPVIEVWRVEKIQNHLKRYNKVGKKHYAYSNWEMYARKVPLLQVLKYMPSSPELATAIALNDSAEIGKQELGLKDAIDGTWTPLPNDDNEPTEVEEEPQNQLPSYSPDQFKKSLASWKDLVDSGKKTVDQIITQISTAYHLSDEELAQIRALDTDTTAPATTAKNKSSTAKSKATTKPAQQNSDHDEFIAEMDAAEQKMREQTSDENS